MFYHRISTAFYTAILLGLLSSCGGGGSGNSKTGSLSGVWDGTYNLTFDSCGVVAEGDTGFLDEQVIEDSAETLTLSSLLSFAEKLDGRVESDGRTVFTDAQSGDVFGDGTLCQVEQSISYQDVDSGSALSLFFLSIICNDGFECETRAVGNCARRE